MVFAREINWHEDVLPRATKDALSHMSTCRWLGEHGWYLAGGTALALQAGHRSSVDLDFFTPEKEFSLNRLIAQLPEKDFVVDIQEPGTLYGVLFGAQMSFIAYPFFTPQEEIHMYGAVPVLDKRDIAVMKIIAISQRGSKRDFVDLYWYSTSEEPLIDILKRVPQQYTNIEQNYQHILKALVYFADAEDEPMPALHFEADWQQIKTYFEKEVPSIARALLQLPEQN